MFKTRIIVSSRVACVIHLTFFDNHDCDIPKFLVTCVGSKMVLAILSFHFQGQGRISKVTASEFIVSMIISRCKKCECACESASC